MNIDLHCHSKFSHDSYLEPEVLIEEAIKKNLDGVCFTEHYSLAASFPVEKIALSEFFYVFRGLEISTDQGHLLVYGLQDDSWNVWSRNNSLICTEVIERVHALGGICAPAHPFRDYDAFGEEVLHNESFNALETHNGRNQKEANQKATHFARLRNLPSLGGSDCHESWEVGRAFTEFANPVYTIKELVKEIRLGNCRGKTKSITDEL